MANCRDCKIVKYCGSAYRMAGECFDRMHLETLHDQIYTDANNEFAEWLTEKSRYGGENIDYKELINKFYFDKACKQLEKEVEIE